MWYRFTARGRETLYGWTEDRAVAEAAVAHLDRLDEKSRREFDFYGFECLGADGVDEETAELCVRLNRGPWDGLLIDDDTTVDEIAAWDKPGSIWIEAETKRLEIRFSAWGAPLHPPSLHEPRMAALGIYPKSGHLILLDDASDTYSPGEDEFAAATIPIFGGIRRDALVAVLRELEDDLNAILADIEDGEFGEEAMGIVGRLEAEVFGENDGANIEDPAYYVGDTVDDLGITSGTTDEELSWIASRLRKSAIAGEQVLVGDVGAFLRRVRAEAEADDVDE